MAETIIQFSGDDALFLKTSEDRTIVLDGDANRFFDEIEAAMASFDQLEIPVVHRQAPGWYLREVSAEEGSLMTSKIHATDHPFVLTKGKCMEWTAEQGVQTMEAPYFGFTKAGTRRIVFAITAITWTTIHATSKTEISDIEKEIFVEYTNPLIKPKELS